MLLIGQQRTSFHRLKLYLQLDTNAGVLFSRLGRTLTTLTEDNPINEAEGSKLRYKELEAKLNTQRKTVEDLKSLGKVFKTTHLIGWA